MHAYHGRDPRRDPPLILGHELAARDRDGPVAGRRVTVNPLDHLRPLRLLRDRAATTCARRRTMIGMTRPGGFAERMPSRSSADRDSRRECPARGRADRTGRDGAPCAEPGACARSPPVAGERGCWSWAAVRSACSRRCSRARTGAATCSSRKPIRCAASRRAERTERCECFDPRPKAAAGRSARISSSMRSAPGARAAPRSRAVKPGGVIVHIGLARLGERDRHAQAHAVRNHADRHLHVLDRRTCARRCGAHGGAFGELDWVEERTLAAGAAAFADLDAGRSGAAKILLRPAS